jgi:hypothetical protein
MFEAIWSLDSLPNCFVRLLHRHHHHHWLYNSVRVLASLKSHLHSSLFIAVDHQLLIHTILASFPTSSLQRAIGLPNSRVGRFPPGRLRKNSPCSEACFGFYNNNNFYGVRLLASCPTPNLEDQGTPFSVGHHLWPVQQERPCQYLHYHQRSSQNHLTTQAPSLHQSRDTFGGEDYCMFDYFTYTLE